LVVRSSPRWATRTSITARASRPQIPRREVLLLLLGERVDGYAHGLQLEPGDLPIELEGNAVDPFRQRGAALHQVLGGESLVGEAHVHYTRGVPLGSGQIDQATV